MRKISNKNQLLRKIQIQYYIILNITLYSICTRQRTYADSSNIIILNIIFRKAEIKLLINENKEAVTERRIPRTNYIILILIHCITVHMHNEPQPFSQQVCFKKIQQLPDGWLFLFQFNCQYFLDRH